MLRHTALFLHRDPVTEAQILDQMKGLAYISYGCPSVSSVDFGQDLFGGSAPLLETKPWKRTPLWDARESGPPCNYDVSLHLDFEDQAALDEYNDDDVHHEVGAYNASICRGELTARVDWYHDGPPRTRRGLVRHTALYLFDDDTTDTQKDDVRAAFSSLEADVPEALDVAVGDNVGPLLTDYDLILDVFAENADAAQAFLDHAATKEAEALAAAVTKYEWTAKLTHVMASG